MNKVLIMAVLLPLNVWAQSVTYNHDESVMNQFTIGEIGAGSFTPDFYYDALHKNYRNGAMMTNKQFYRSQMNLVLYQEVPHAEAIDSALTERMRIEADLAWQVEKSKIEGKLSILRSNIERITLEGGSVSSYQTWLQRYNAINCGLQAVRDAYMPQGSRKQQYLAIYKDILQKTVEVCDYISYLRKLKEVKKQPNSAPAPRHSHIYTVCRAAHGRWKVAMAAGSGVGE